ncbi:hypothetical protein RE628_05975 [Paenibacillus sp. D2_2]|uniref:hypothetical protein n=1 Tax=Paenibacillus sp. D2_2 TaxID=3073092 RepID=UPI0028151536|nr:hypothetical protein [Paenibacillus sp. D2_2]WMT41985.1 hypothetical protein RE628_05975 [Paenibacillus sp. D2_2]
MRKAKATLQDDQIRELLINKELDDIDVRLSVMNRVREIHERGSSGKGFDTGPVSLLRLPVSFWYCPP